MFQRHHLLSSAAALMLATIAPGMAQTAEVIHWWTSGGESAAVRVFADQFTKAGGKWVDTAIAGGVNARTAALNRTIGGNPPTAMQFNTGKQFDELVEGVPARMSTQSPPSRTGKPSSRRRSSPPLPATAMSTPRR